MTQADLNANGRNRTLRGLLALVGRHVVPILLALGGQSSALAGEGEWTLLLEPMYMDAFGHDQQILTIHEIDSSSTPSVETSTPVTLDTDAGIAYRFELQYTRSSWEDWGLGFDFFWFAAAQGGTNRTAAASGPTGPIDEVVFETSNRQYTSTDPSQALFFGVLADTDIAAWTVDLYALKTLGEKTSRSGLYLQLGLRNADFDNDVHTVVGTEGVNGTLFDAASNYGRMIGPIVGFAGDIRFGKSAFRGYIGQSVVFGTAELTNLTRDFTGPFTDPPAVTAQDIFGTVQDVAIPITEFRINWLYPISKRVSLGLAANTSIWWDVPVPPGVVPTGGSSAVFHENTIVFFGLGLSLKLSM